ncbi:hypothetical protein [Ferruginibacter sp. SUN106]|uniref:hypothetical protein n=1 Tax=Ferruginibacter sp. SUN106 TaxID=2978348 RepID=UPI003D364484
MIEIEFEDPIIDKCECCGKDMVRLTRFVSQDGDAFAVYFAKFTRNHDDRVLYGLISLGEWGEGSLPENRTAFPFKIWVNADNYQVGLTNKEESPWSNEEYLGKILDRKEALIHPWIKDVFHVTDHMVRDDKEIVEYFK